MFPAESVEQFKNRVENGLRRGTSYSNYFATLRSVDRPVTIKVKSEKRLTPKERIAILMELL